jgi:hypothetical protein
LRRLRNLRQTPVEGGAVLTSLHALREREPGLAPKPDRLAPAAPVASEEAIRLALHLRDVRGNAGGRLFLFVPASASVDTSAVVADALCGLLELHEGPVLVVDFRPSEETDMPASIRDLATDADQPGAGWSSGSAALMRPFATRREKVLTAASPEFAARLVEARSRYACVLCIADEVPTSVEMLMVAPLVDGVVLVVAPNRTTRPEMQRLTDQLRRTQTNLLGFVVDARTKKGAGR